MGNIFYYKTPIGKIGIVEDEGKITNVYFETNNIPRDVYKHKETDILKEANRQLQDYFNGKLTTFSLEFAPSGTEFMKEVWNALLEIPYGETRSYKQIAQRTGHNFAYRAVGLANNRNPIPIFIPCHRVIGSNQTLVGYGGGLNIKKHLLELENKFKPEIFILNNDLKRVKINR